MTEQEIILKLQKLAAENRQIMAKISRDMQTKLNLKGHLRIFTRRNNYYYYLISRKDDTNGKYLSKKNTELIKNLSQRDYSAKILKILNKNNKAIGAFIKAYTSRPLETIFQTQHAGKQKFITPVKPTDEQFEKLWQNQKYRKPGFAENAPELFTSKGERVRSKSEIIIANLLEKQEIPYLYEKPLKINEKLTLHPDFTCLNRRTRQEFLWEHFGLMDSPEYAANAVSKISAYQAKGYFPGKNLLITFETSETLLQTKTAEAVIREFLV